MRTLADNKESTGGPSVAEESSYALPSGWGDNGRGLEAGQLPVASLSCGKTPRQKRIILADDLIELAEMMSCVLANHRPG